MNTHIPLVKVCDYCHSQNTTDVSGFESLRLDAWFCHKYCHNLALVKHGHFRHANNPELFRELMDSRKRLFPSWEEKINGETFTINKIQHNIRCLREDKRCKRIKVIKRIFGNEEEVVE